MIRGECVTTERISAPPTRRYEVEDHFTVPPPRDPISSIDVWCPLIPNTPYQRVVAMAVDAPAPWTIGHDAEHGNRLLHARLPAPRPGGAAFRIRYTVERWTLVPVLDPAYVRPLDSPALFLDSLRAEQFVDVDDRTRAIAREVVIGATDELEQARKIYEHVTGTMTYDAAEQSWKGSTEHALACSMGNCNDIHALFISLCRSVAIPARLVLGQAFEPPPPGQDACELCGYHCWAEFFVAGLGWVPADASCACKYGKDHLFGDLELNHIAWSVGRDILLEPPQRGGRLLFLAGPYVEADGRPSPHVERGIGFAEVERPRQRAAADPESSPRETRP
jgi:transglutaminase-like putative cysteine protease